MPLYPYMCKKCQMKSDVVRAVDDRNNPPGADPEDGKRPECTAEDAPVVDGVKQHDWERQMVIPRVVIPAHHRAVP